LDKVGYIINSETLILLPLENEKTKVFEVDNVLVVNDSVENIVKNSCYYFGSSLKGRQDGTKNMLNCRIKVPIVVEDSKKMIFFPTHSHTNAENVWVSFNNLLKYTKYDKGTTIFHFKNNNEINVKVTYNVVDNQIIRCIKLDSILSKRKKEMIRDY